MQIDEPLLPIDALSFVHKPTWVFAFLVEKGEAHLALAIWVLLHPSNELVYLFIYFLFKFWETALDVSDLKEITVNIFGANEAEGSMEEYGMQDASQHIPDLCWFQHQLLQLTGFAVHLRSRLQIGAEEIDPSKLGPPHEQEEQSIRGADGSALPAVHEGELGEVHGGEPAREEVEVAC